MKEQVSLVEVLNYYGDLGGLSREDKVLVGACPFCDEKAFTVAEGAQRYACSSCGRRGGILDLVAEKEDVRLPVAALIIADRFGVEAPDWEPPGDTEDVPLSPAVSAVATSAGLVLGHITALLERPEEIFPALKQIYFVANATFMSAERQRW